MRRAAFISIYCRLAFRPDLMVHAMRNFLPFAGVTILAFVLVTNLAAAQGYAPMAAEGDAGQAAEPEEAAPPNPELVGLPDAEGAEETYYQCVACHSMAIIKQQRVSDERWDYLWRWMVEEQGMFEPDEETKETVLRYLKQHFS